jgi:hypothetical protein
MMKKILAALFLLWSCAAHAQIIPTLPVTLQNGTLADANQVMSNFNTIVTGTNTNGAKNGVNSDITALNALVTPLTPAQGGSSIYTAGTSTGSDNAQVVASPLPTGFSLVAGKTVMFTAGFSNTGATTLNVASTGAVNVFQRTAGGAVALAGGEIVAGTVVMAYYDGTQYQLIDSIPQNVVAPCTMIDYAGVTTPSGYLPTDGTTRARATFVNLFNCITNVGVAATTTAASASVTVADSTGYQIGWYVGGTNVTCNSTIVSKADGTHFTMSAVAGGSGATTLTVGPYPQGDCSTTFNLPDTLGRATVQKDSSGGVLTSAQCTNPNTIGSKCGTETKTLVTANLPPYTPSGTNSAGAALLQWTTTNAAPGANTAVNNLVASGGTVGPVSLAFTNPTFTGNAQGGTSTPVSSIPPILLVTKAIKF